MPATSETLVTLVEQLAERLLDFERRDAAWPRGHTAVERAEIGRQREGALSGVAALRDRIITSRAETLADAAVQLRRLAVEAGAEGSSLREMLAEPDMRRLVASVLAVVEREAGNEAARDITFYNILDTRKPQLEAQKSPLKPGQRHMIGARWADAEGGRPVNTAHAQGNEKTTVTVASKALKVGERGIYHARVVLSQGTPESIETVTFRNILGI